MNNNREKNQVIGIPSIFHAYQVPGSIEIAGHKLLLACGKYSKETIDEVQAEHGDKVNHIQCTHKDSHYAISRFKYLEYLIISVDPSVQEEKDLQSDDPLILPQSLIHLFLSDQNLLDSFYNFFPQLTSLQVLMLDSPNLTNAYLKTICESNKTIHTLIIESRGQFKLNLQLLELFPQLKILKLLSVQLDKNCLQQIAEFCPNVKNLALENTKISDCKELISFLNLTDCTLENTDISNEHFQVICKSSQDLRYLSIRKENQITRLVDCSHH